MEILPNPLQIIVILVVVLCIGVVNLARKKKRLHEKIHFAKTFLNRLKKYTHSKGKDDETYSWLTSHSVHLQRQLNDYGLAVSYRPPFESYIVENYQVAINLIPEIREAFHSSFNIQYAYTSTRMLENTILQHVGVLEEQEEKNLSRLKNPIWGLTEGVSIIISLPVNILYWVGLIPIKTKQTIISHYFFKLISAAFTFIGILSIIITIFTGWNDFVIILTDFLSKIFQR